MPIGYLLITAADAILKLPIVSIDSSKFTINFFSAGMEPTSASNRLIDLNQLQKKDKNFGRPKGNYQY